MVRNQTAGSPKRRTTSSAMGNSHFRMHGTIFVLLGEFHCGQIAGMSVTEGQVFCSGKFEPSWNAARLQHYHRKKRVRKLQAYPLQTRSSVT